MTAVDSELICYKPNLERSKLATRCLKLLVIHECAWPHLFAPKYDLFAAQKVHSGHDKSLPSCFSHQSKGHCARAQITTPGVIAFQKYVTWTWRPFLRTGDQLFVTSGGDLRIAPKKWVVFVTGLRLVKSPGTLRKRGPRRGMFPMLFLLSQ